MRPERARVWRKVIRRAVRGRNRAPREAKPNARRAWHTPAPVEPEDVTP